MIRAVQVVETDAQLVARCREGDDDAWRELVERFSRYVYAIAVQAFRLPQSDAEDVFQEVFARAYENLPKLRDDGAIRPWLAQLTRRLCLDTLRAGAREQVGRPAASRQASTRRSRSSTRRSPCTRRSPTLPDNCREILDRFFARDESYRSIAEALDIPAGHDREPDLPLPGEAAERARGKKSGRCGVWWLTAYAATTTRKPWRISFALCPPRLRRGCRLRRRSRSRDAGSTTSSSGPAPTEPSVTR